VGRLQLAVWAVGGLALFAACNRSWPPLARGEADTFGDRAGSSMTCAADDDCPLGAVCDAPRCRVACAQESLPTVFFDFDETVVRPDQRDEIEELALCLRAWRDRELSLRGYCATVDVFSDRNLGGHFCSIGRGPAREASLRCRGA
jgi:hypothetical protein